jgi:hypothetical protein
MAHLCNKSVQILAYVDDVDIVARSNVALIHAFHALENTANKMGLRVDQEKTKYMLVDPRKERWKAPAVWPLKVEYKFERVQSFMHLRTMVNIWNDISEEIKTRIMAANRSCFGLPEHLISQISSQEQLKSSYIKLLLNQL